MAQVRFSTSVQASRHDQRAAICDYRTPTVMSADDRNAIEDRASRLVGLHVAGVRYLTIDYERWQRAPESTGRRLIVDDEEWRSPSWSYSSGDSVDFGVELVMQEELTFSLSWKGPGPREGLAVQDGIIDRHANAAVWDVANRSRWSRLIGHAVSDVVPHFARWGQIDSELWLPRISISFSNEIVEVLLGACERDGSQIVPSGNNVAILFNPDQLPDWIPAEVLSA
jgi:hypothetical protein